MAILYNIPEGWEGSALSGLIMHRTVGADTAIVQQCGNHDIVADIRKLNGYSPYCDPGYAKPGQVVKVKTMPRLKAPSDGDFTGFEMRLIKAVEWCNRTLGCPPLSEVETQQLIQLCKSED